MKLRLEDITFGYSEVPVLHDISLEFDGPQFVSIIGPNGVGKSTLIHCINKLLEPTSGSVWIDDLNVHDMTMKELSKVIGYVPYSANDTFSMSVVDTVLMGRHPHTGWKTTDHDLDIVFETLKLLKIEDLAMRPFNQLSAGQHQRVMLARGIVQEPKILLLDEPTSNLDIRHQIDVTVLLKELSESKDTLVIMISHDINIAAKYSDKIIMMHEGRIFAVGDPNTVITEENIRMVYGVNSRIIDDFGRPHVILEGTIGDASGS